MKHTIPHDLELELAKKATVKAFEGYERRFADYNPTANWTSDTECDISFGAKGMTLNGHVELTPKAVELELDVPFLLRPFKNKAINVIEEEINEWIVRAKNGELDDE